MPNGSSSFHNWLASQGKTKATIKETVNYAKRFATVLDTGDASQLLTLSPRNKQHAMTALANLAKYQGQYDKFLQLRQRYNLKWSKGDSMQSFQRFFNEQLSFDVMLQRIKEMIRLLPPFMGNIIRFACLIGLRASEVCESVRLLNSSTREENFGHPGVQKYTRTSFATRVTSNNYYNPERQALEHFRFPDVFIRQTKKAYISFITREQLSAIGILDCKTHVPTYNQIRLACWTRHIKMDMHLCRKIFASWLRKEGIQPEVIDLLQGRVSQSILTRHYLVPQITLKDDVLNALEKLQRQLD